MAVRRDTVPINPLFVRSGEVTEHHRTRLASGEMLPETARQIVADEAMLDGNARLNLATFVSTWMEPEALELYAGTVDKNMIDKDEYPETAAIEERCWRILADLWHAPDPAGTIGTSTIGSSEACMLAGLAFKRRWQTRRRAAGLSTENPNIVMSSAVQVCWEKFANYFEVEARYVPVSDEHPALDGAGVTEAVDENTIGVVAIMGVTYTGIYEPVVDIAAALDRLAAASGPDIPIHIDGASGGFIAPFLQPDLEWDFRCERVHSISASGHKYGLVYPGVGWVVWRDADCLPEDLIFRVSYLGGNMPTLALNFSRPGSQVLLQYYNFLRLGRAGYTAVQAACRDVARYLSDGIARLGPFTLRSDGSDIPVFAWQLAAAPSGNWSLHDLSDQLRQRGWLVPAYPLPDNLSDRTVQRIVVRNGLSIDLADQLLASIGESVTYLDSLSGPMPTPRQRSVSFHH
jgi:glutamate decarboxylase